jgi:non-specific serine/threonine protein kinase
MSTMVEPTLTDRARIHPIAPVRLPRRERFGPPLPLPVSSFVGREQEAGLVLALLRQPGVRLVTLTGPGGVGKTRLAIRAAEVASRDEFANAATFVSLATVADSAQVVPTIARILGIRETGKRPQVDRLVDVLRDRHLLLVLDNFEQVVDAAPDLIGLLEACPHLTILATSRVSLNLTGEQVVTIQPLTLPPAGNRASATTIAQSEAIQLFVARAQATRRDFALTDDNATVIAAIVGRLEGLPLAIELAAARTAHLTPTALLARLDLRLPLLTGGARDLPERQRTMAATIGWSHDLLTTPEQVLLRRLSVFANGFTLEAAEAVCGPQAAGNREQGTEDRDPVSCSLFPVPAVLDGIASLVNSSLLRQDAGPDGEPRYTMLDTVREFGLEQLATNGEERDVRGRHASWCVALAERADISIWGGPEHGLWLDRIDAELANARSALTWLDKEGDGASLLRLAAALGGLWTFRSYRVEGLAWLRRALAYRDVDEPAARAMALIKLTVLDRTMAVPRRIDAAAEAVAIRRNLNDVRSTGRGVLCLANCYARNADDEKATAAFEEAETLLASVGDLSGLGMLHSSLGFVALSHGDHERGRRSYAEALELYERDDFAQGIAAANFDLGWIATDQGEAVVAAAHFAISLRQWGEIKNQEGQVETLAATGCLAVAKDQPVLAIHLLCMAEELSGLLGFVESLANRPRIEQALTEARAALTDEAFASASAIGRALSLEETTALAAAFLDGATDVTMRDTETSMSSNGYLTPREHEVLVLIAEGLSDREVADKLFVGAGTIRSHLTSIFGKLEVGSRTAAIATARRRGII